MKHWYERVLDQVSIRYQLNPSNWIPHIKVPGLYEMGYAYSSVEDFIDEEGKLKKGEEVPIQCFSFYSAMETVCRERAKQRLSLEGDEWIHAKLGFWCEFWGFLAEIDTGIFDTTNWVEISPPEAEHPAFAHHPR